MSLMQNKLHTRFPACRYCSKTVLFTLMLLSILAVFPTLATAEPTPNASSPTAQAQVVERIESGPVAAVVEIDRNEVLIVEPIQWTLQARAPRGVELELITDDEQWQPFAILDHKTTPAVPDGDQRVWTWIYSIDTTETGTLQTPALKLTWKDNREHSAAHNTFGELALPQLEVNVASILEADADPLKIHGLKPPLAMPESQTPTNWLTITLIAVGATTLLALMLVAARKLNTKKRSAYQQALQQFESLKAEMTDNPDFDLATGYACSIDTLRQYLETRCSIPAMNMTSSQLIASLQTDTRVESTNLETTTQCIQLADTVKFAQLEPESQHLAHAISTFRSLIEDIEQKLTEASSKPSAPSTIENIGGHAS